MTIVVASAGFSADIQHVRYEIGHGASHDVTSAIQNISTGAISAHDTHSIASVLRGSADALPHQPIDGERENFPSQTVGVSIRNGLNNGRE